MPTTVSEIELLGRLEDNDRLFLRRFCDHLDRVFRRIHMAIAAINENQFFKKIAVIERSENKKLEKFLTDEVVHVFAIGEAHAALLCRDRIRQFKKNKLADFVPWFLGGKKLSKLMEVDPADFWLKPTEAMAAFKLRENMLAKDVNGVLWQDVRRIMDEHLDGVSRRDTLAKLEKLQKVTEQRAELIVTTESTYAYNRGRLSGFKKAEVDYVRFSAVMDMRTSPQCRSRHGKVMRIDGAEIAGNTPPLHGRCRSILSPLYSKYEPEEITPETTDWSKVAPLPKNWRTGSGDSAIIKSKDVKAVEQAKKRDHKIMVTDVAIDKVGLVNIKGFSPLQNQLLRQEHKNILNMAKLKNNSNEVLSICSSDFSKRVYTLGSEFEVDPNNNIESVLLIKEAKPRTLLYLHNHPSTNNFSTTDIMTFFSEHSIRVMSVVTNQGKVYVLHKSEKYDYNKIKEIFRNILKQYDRNTFDGDEIVRRFLSSCGEGGVDYEQK